MTAIAQRITTMVDVLPEQEQMLAFELVKRMVLGWDPEFSKSTAEETASMELGCAEIMRGETVAHNQINWN